MGDFAAVRITLPRLRAGLVQRPRLQARLGAALSSAKLVLLSAPAGYGKTVTLVQQLRLLPPDHAVAWVRISEDDDLQRLLGNLLKALDPFDLPWRMSPEALPEVALREGGWSKAVEELAHGLTQAEVVHGVMAFDDVHRIADPRVFDFFEGLLKVLPATWTMAMTARWDPPLPLARMMMAGELAEFRQNELRFQREDVQALLQAAQQPATPERVDQLLERTQGWVVGLGLELTAQTARHHDRLAQRRTFDYLAQEVFGQMPPGLQTFLLRCSVLPELNVTRCGHVSGDARAAYRLAELERLESFVTVLGDKPLTLRLHDLFREFLEGKLAREHFEEVPQLLKRAAESEPDLVLRVGYLLRAGAADEAIGQMLDAALPLIQAGAGEQLMRLAEKFPPDLREKSSDLAFVRALFAWHGWGFNTVSSLMRHAAVGFERGRRWQLAVKARALGAMALFHVGRCAEAVALLEEAPRIEREPATELVWQMSAIVRSANVGPSQETPMHVQRVVETLRSSPEARDWMSAIHTLFAYVGRFGVMEPMRRLVDLIVALGADDRPLLRGGFTSVMRAWLALWQADLPAARALAAEAEADAAWAGNPSSLVAPLQILHAMDYQVSGDADAMRRTLGEVARVASQSHERRSDVLYLTMLGGFSVGNQDWPVAREILEQVAPKEPLYDWPYFHAMCSALRAELAMHDGRIDEAVQEFRQFGPHAVDCDWWGLHARVSVSWARAELRAGDAGKAWQVLSPALRMAADTKEVLGMLLSGPAALQELASARWTDEAQTPEVNFLKACARRATELRVSPAAPAAAPAVGAADQQPRHDVSALLSDREIGVLRLIAAGRSNKHIARELNLSPHTVKRHVARILAKTDQNSRGQAAAWLHAADGSLSRAR